MKRFNGKPCRKCGGTLRYVSGKQPCVPCHKQRVKDSEARHPEKTKIRRAAKYVRAKKRNPALFLFKSAQARARLKGFVFTITVDDIVIPAACPLLDIPIFASAKQATNHSPTLDRKDSRAGYVPGNVWVVSYRANMIKSNASAEELLRIAVRLQALKVT